MQIFYWRKGIELLEATFPCLASSLTVHFGLFGIWLCGDMSLCTTPIAFGEQYSLLKLRINIIWFKASLLFFCKVFVHHTTQTLFISLFQGKIEAWSTLHVQEHTERVSCHTSVAFSGRCHSRQRAQVRHTRSLAAGPTRWRVYRSAMSSTWVPQRYHQGE